MDFLLVCLKAVRGVAGVLKALGALNRLLPLGKVLRRVGMALMEGWQSLRRSMTPKWRAFSRNPTLRRLMERLSETVLLYLIALVILAPGPFYALLGRIRIEKHPAEGLLLMGVCLLSMFWGARYWKFAKYSKEALNREWMIYRRNATAASYAKLWTLTLALPTVAFLYEVAPSLLLSAG